MSRELEARKPCRSCSRLTANLSGWCRACLDYHKDKPRREADVQALLRGVRGRWCRA